MSTDSKYRSNVDKIGQKIDELQEILTGEQYKKLEHMLDMNTEINNIENQAMYAEGVRFGIELMVENYRVDKSTER